MATLFEIEKALTDRYGNMVEICARKTPIDIYDDIRFVHFHDVEKWDEETCDPIIKEGFDIKSAKALLDELLKDEIWYDEFFNVHLFDDFSIEVFFDSEEWE